MKPLSIFVLLFLASCTKESGVTSTLIDIPLHTMAIKAKVSGEKTCYIVLEPNVIAGRFCLEYLGSK